MSSPFHATYINKKSIVLSYLYFILYFLGNGKGKIQILLNMVGFLINFREFSKEYTQ